MEEALRPWRGRMSIVVHLKFDPTKYVTGVPQLNVALEGPTIVLPIDVKSSGQYTGGDQSVVGGFVEAVFEAESVGQAVRPVVVRRNGKEIARVPIDFSKLD